MRSNLASDPRRGGRGTAAARKRRRWRLQPTVLALENRRLLSTFTVNSTGDTGSGSGLVGDLRYCITQANSAGGNETITFDKTVFKTPQTINLDPTLGQLELSDTTGTEAIVGPGKGVTVDAGGGSRVFQIDGGVTASMSGLTITGGKTTGNGGGLFNDGGNVSLTNCTVSGNSATTPASSLGGGLFSLNGTLTLTNCTVSGNSSSHSGGGLYSLYSTATLTNCTVSDNTAGRNGGGVVSRGTTLALTNCTVSGNSAVRIGGGIAAVFGGSATLTNCT